MILSQEMATDWNSIKDKNGKRIKSLDVPFRKKLFTREYFDKKLNCILIDHEVLSL
tara:strand:+ start:608 stop:775 length:168 start_codon:yes stop_codon:yes gene_type:complete